jgi:hypothetical protein
MFNNGRSRRCMQGHRCLKVQGADRTSFRRQPQLIARLINGNPYLGRPFVCKAEHGLLAAIRSDDLDVVALPVWMRRDSVDCHRVICGRRLVDHAYCHNILGTNPP